jgi:hypothetical protein
MIFSITALLVALLGTTPLGDAAYNAAVPRNGVGTLQLQRNAVKAAKIAPNAIRTGHVLDGSLLAADFKSGQIPQGPKGDRGDKGDKGDTGLVGISGYEIVQQTSPVDATSPKDVTAACPSGKRVIGGGSLTSGSGDVFASTDVPTDPAGWHARAWKVPGTAVTVVWGVQVYAICARVS